MPVGFNVTVDLGDIPARFDLLIQRIETAKVAEMPTEFVEWQTDDMKRSFPNIDIGSGIPEPDDTWAQTTIWPRSRLSMMKDMQRRKGKPVRRRQSTANPILRYELFGKLIARMQKILGEIRWH